jgi:predicted nucleotidyltransferase
MEISLPDLPVLSDVERSCLVRYVTLLVERLGEQLEEVILFGSVARGESWPRGMPIRSDLDLLVVSAAPLDEATTDELLDATLPLFLESGRQIGPQFRTREQLEQPPDERARAFLANLERDRIRLYARSF